MNDHKITHCRNLVKNEKGITALETAIILIAFIVAAALFAFTILAAGVASTERGQEAVLSGLDKVQSTIELRGQIVAVSSTSGLTTTIESLVFTVANALNGSPIDMTDSSNNANKLIIDYYDNQQQHSNLDWDIVWMIGDGDILLEKGELAEITITNLDTQLTSPLSINTRFTLEIKPPQGNTLILKRATPSYIEQINTLN